MFFNNIVFYGPYFNYNSVNSIYCRSKLLSIIIKANLYNNMHKIFYIWHVFDGYQIIEKILKYYTFRQPLTKLKFKLYYVMFQNNDKLNRKLNKNNNDVP